MSPRVCSFSRGRAKHRRASTSPGMLNPEMLNPEMPQLESLETPGYSLETPGYLENPVDSIEKFLLQVFGAAGFEVPIQAENTVLGRRNTSVMPYYAPF